MSRSYTSSPPKALVACSGTAFRCVWKVNRKHVERTNEDSFNKDELEKKIFNDKSKKVIEEQVTVVLKLIG
jgi:hypothetical protein